MEHLLTQAATDLTIRSEVEATLSSALHEVEHAHFLEQALSHQQTLRRTEEQLDALQLRYDEREAAWEEERREKERMGVWLMEEVVRLSGQLGETGLKERSKFGEGCTEEMGDRKEEPKKARTMADSVEVVEAEEQLDLVNDEISNEPSQNVAEARTSIKTSRQKNKTTFPEPAPDQITQDANATDENPFSEMRETVKNQLQHKRLSEQPEHPEQPKPRKILPHDLVETSLMTIFTFLDPLDVMNFAQTNKAMFSKIDVLFGTGSGSEVSEDIVEVGAGDNSEVQKEGTERSENEASLATSTTAPVAVENGETVSSTSSVGQAPTGATVPSAPTVLPSAEQPAKQPLVTSTKSATSSPNLFSMPSPPISISNIGNIGTPSTPGGTFSSMFSRFGGAAPPSPSNAGSVAGNPPDTSFVPSSSSFTSATTIAATPTIVSSTSNLTTAAVSREETILKAQTSHTSSPPTDTPSEIKLNAAMATSMASKLTPAELAVILRMREKLQKCGADAERHRLEKEDVLANLASVEAVKEFLVTRVRGVEIALEVEKKEKEEVNKRNLADQEVIVFLDDKVKKLEKDLEEWKSKETAARREKEETVTKNYEKVRVLSDMLRFEREQMGENEKEWKAAKKVLVKEVKSCRAMIVQLQAEMEGLGEQNLQLKEGLRGLMQGGGQGGGQVQKRVIERNSPGKKVVKSC